MDSLAGDWADDEMEWLNRPRYEWRWVEEYEIPAELGRVPELCLHRELVRVV